MRRFNILFAIVVCAFTLSVSTQASQCKVNGCGSGISRYVIPNSILGVDFKPSCNVHDECYSRCLKSCGINYGNENLCDLSKAARKLRRSACDNTFLTNMRSACKQVGIFRGFACNRVAENYFAVVSVVGGGFFHGMIPKDETTRIAVTKNASDILAFEAEKHFLKGETSDVIEALKRNNSQTFKDFEKLLKDSKPKQELPLNKLNKNEALKFLQNYDASQKIAPSLKPTAPHQNYFDSLDEKTMNSIFENLQYESE